MSRSSDHRLLGMSLSMSSLLRPMSRQPPMSRATDEPAATDQPAATDEPVNQPVDEPAATMSLQPPMSRQLRINRLLR
jgi:hypothetical protein